MISSSSAVNPHRFLNFSWTISTVVLALLLIKIKCFPNDLSFPMDYFIPSNLTVVLGSFGHNTPSQSKMNVSYRSRMLAMFSEVKHIGLFPLWQTSSMLSTNWPSVRANLVNVDPEFYFSSKATDGKTLWGIIRMLHWDRESVGFMPGWLNVNFPSLRSGWLQLQLTISIRCCSHAWGVEATTPLIHGFMGNWWNDKHCGDKLY